MKKRHIKVLRRVWLFVAGGFFGIVLLLLAVIVWGALARSDASLVAIARWVSEIPGSTWAGWAQAFGTLAAIAFTATLGQRQLRVARRHHEI
ncbi:hypothetical protein [Radicibacter daui]|uniref:hypothetical protein n=1 Tax=Radicibacter daui TaxID=3064829 RepID=UPI004046C0D2